MADWPELGQELARKGLGQVERLSKLHEAGKITRREMAIALDVLCESTQGLMERDAWDVTYGALREVRGARQKR